MALEAHFSPIAKGMPEVRCSEDDRFENLPGAEVNLLIGRARDKFSNTLIYWGLDEGRLREIIGMNDIVEVGREEFGSKTCETKLVVAMAAMSVMAAEPAIFSTKSYRVGAVGMAFDDEKVHFVPAYRGELDYKWHAEYQVLEKMRDAGVSMKDGWLASSLEPCSHRSEHKKIPSCAQSMIDEGVARFIFTQIDKAPKINGKGIEALIENQVEVFQVPWLIPASAAVTAHLGHFQQVLKTSIEKDYDPGEIVRITGS